MRVDIIGGGLSGLSTALSIKTHDNSIEVFVHDKHAKIGDNSDARKCGEAHSVETFSLKWIPPDEAIASTITKAETIIGDTVHYVKRKPGTAWILFRPRYIYYLGNKAKKNGVNFILNHKIDDVSKLPGDIIVDASGCPSIVKKQIKIPQRLIGSGFQQTIENCNVFEKNKLRIMFDKCNGYYWIFPRDSKKKEVNIGVGFNRTKTKLPSLLDEYKKNHEISGKVNYSTGGLIPIGIQYPLIYKNILFVGDAGVGTLPLDGQGIYRALMSGDEAGYFIANRDIDGYRKKMIELFFKMDVIGKTLIRWHNILHYVNKNYILQSWNHYMKLNEIFSFFKSEYDLDYQKEKIKS